MTCCVTCMHSCQPLHTHTYLLAQLRTPQCVVQLEQGVHPIPRPILARVIRIVNPIMSQAGHLHASKAKAQLSLNSGLIEQAHPHQAHTHRPSHSCLKLGTCVHPSESTSTPEPQTWDLSSTVSQAKIFAAGRTQLSSRLLGGAQLCRSYTHNASSSSQNTNQRTCSAIFSHSAHRSWMTAMK